MSGQECNINMSGGLFEPTDTQLLDWWKRFDDFEDNPSIERRILCRSQSSLDMNEKTVWLIDNEHPFKVDKDENENNPCFRRDGPTMIHTKRLIHKLCWFENYVNICKGRFDDVSNVFGFEIDFSHSWYMEMKNHKPIVEWNFKLFTPQGVECFNQNFIRRQFIDNVRSKILPELIKKNRLMDFLFCDTFEYHLTPSTN